MRIDARLSSLKRQHKALDEEIKSQQADTSSSTLDIWTLKRKKLALKEQITALSRKYLAE
ncbi:MAG: YdcH family protein [Parvibaculales bacterium]